MSEESTQLDPPQADDSQQEQNLQSGTQPAYLKAEVNILRPSTPYMRDHLRIIWTGFAVWVLTTFGPATLTVLFTDTMTQPLPGLGFPTHYFLIAVGSPTAALVLSAWYARQRDKLDRKYRTDRTGTTAHEQTEAVVADGGVER